MLWLGVVAMVLLFATPLVRVGAHPVSVHRCSERWGAVGRPGVALTDDVVHAEISQRDCLLAGAERYPAVNIARFRPYGVVVQRFSAVLVGQVVVAACELSIRAAAQPVCAGQRTGALAQNRCKGNDVQ